jgi:phenolic acid decarboxylase
MGFMNYACSFSLSFMLFEYKENGFMIFFSWIMAIPEFKVHCYTSLLGGCFIFGAIFCGKG